MKKLLILTIILVFGAMFIANCGGDVCTQLEEAIAAACPTDESVEAPEAEAEADAAVDETTCEEKLAEIGKTEAEVIEVLAKIKAAENCEGAMEAAAELYMPSTDAE